MTSRIAATYWAQAGKPARTKDDYAILSWGPSIGAAAADDRAARVWDGVPGEPTLGSSPGPGKLPWATCAPYRDAAGWSFMTITATDATKDRDAVGRPTAAIRHVEIPFAALSAGNSGYQTLYQAIPALTTTQTGESSEPLYLDLPGAGRRPSLGLAAGDAFDRAARLAALLLCGEVLITLSETDRLPLSERLAEFDRVLALLPFGIRAGIALASWQDGTQRTPFRLAYGRFPERNQAVVAHNGPVRPPAAAVPAVYLSDLIELRKQYGAARIIEHLGGHRWPVHPDDAIEAHAILRSIAGPRVVIEAIRAGTAAPDRVATALRFADQTDADQIDPDERDELERCLLSAGGSVAEQALAERWCDRTARVAAQVVLAELARPREFGELSAHRWSSSGWRLRAYAARYGGADGFLAAIATGRTQAGSPVPAAVVAACLDGTPPETGQLPGLRLALFDHPPLARWLLRLSLRRGLPAAGWIDWLNPAADDVPDWLGRYAVLVTDPGSPLPVPADRVVADAGAEDAGAEDLALIAWLAVQDRSFAALAQEWWPPLLRLARTGAAPPAPDDPAKPAIDRARGDLADLVGLTEARRASSGDLLTDARVDTLCLYLGLRPVHYPRNAGSASCRRYLGALWTTWSEPSAEADISTLAVRLLDAVFGGTRQFRQPAFNPYHESAVTLLREVVADHRVPLTDEVTRAIARIITTTAPRLDSGSLLAPDWWDRMEQVRPGLRDSVTQLAAALAQESPAADPFDVAVLCGKAAVSGRAPDELARMVLPWFARHPPQVREAMFRITEGVLRLADPADDSKCEDYLAILVDSLGFPELRRLAALFEPRKGFRRRRPSAP